MASGGVDTVHVAHVLHSKTRRRTADRVVGGDPRESVHCFSFGTVWELAAEARVGIAHEPPGVGAPTSVLAL